MQNTPNPNKSERKKPSYLKVRGYRHLTGKKTDFSKSEHNLVRKLGESKNVKIIEAVTESISKYNFLPLLKYIKIENKYKKQLCPEAKKANKAVFLHKTKQLPLRKNEPKKRPIEYPAHRDAVIYAFYAQEILAPMYEHLLSQNDVLHESVIGYRKITNPNNIGGKNKSTIHFAKDVFEHIREVGKCYVLTFDVKDFFPSLQHAYLKDALLGLLQNYISNPKDIQTIEITQEKNEEERKEEIKKYERLHKKIAIWKPYIENKKLPPDLYNLFKAVTKYAYIMLRDLKRKDSKQGFDEARLAQIRKQGIDAFFANSKEMRNYLFENEIPIYKNGKSGIPHGLPISAYLANIYMKTFDESVCTFLQGIDKNCLYKRYSDDMIVIFPKKEDKERIEKHFINEIGKIDLKLSLHKTEFFEVTKNEEGLLKTSKTIAYKIINNKCDEIIEDAKSYPITYLGLEFYGERQAENEVGKRLDIRIKNASIQKFYRRMDMAIRRQVRRAFLNQEKDLIPKPIVFRRRLYRLFSLRGSNRKYRNKPTEKPKPKITPRVFRSLLYDEKLGYFIHKIPSQDEQQKKGEKEKMRHQGNAITFAKRCDFIFWYAEIVGKKGVSLPSVMFRQYKKANRLLEKRIFYWIKKYKEFFSSQWAENK